MYKHHIDKMTDNVMERLKEHFKYIDMLSEEELERAVRAGIDEYWKDKIAVTWCVFDVQVRANEVFTANISRGVAKDILEDILSHNDSEIGITWDTLDSAIENFLNM